MPIVDFNSCGGKEDCVAVCPYAVFEMRPISKEDKAKLNFKGQIKTLFFKKRLTLLILNCVMLVVFVFRLARKRR